MANKIAALLVVCLVFIAAVQLPHAQADDYGKCFNGCQSECESGGNGHTFCEMKCDTDCQNQVVEAKLNANLP